MANMLNTVHGKEAEGVAGERLAQAIESGDEADEIVWRGILTQLERIRSEKRR